MGRANESVSAAPALPGQVGPDAGAATVAGPRPGLTVLDGVAIMVGIVVGIGIFRTPSLVAANVPSEFAFIAVWVLGGLITLAGALVYAELAAAYPSTGGEYHFLVRAFGLRVGFLFAWARISVIQTGAIAAVAFVFGDYAQQVHSLGPQGAPIYAALALVALTAINLVGTTPGKRVQSVFTGLTLVAIVVLVGIGFSTDSGAATAEAAAEPVAAATDLSGALGLAMVFILLTYGGWNEAAYLSAEVHDGRRNMVRVLAYGTAAIAGLYVLINLAFLHVLGFEALRQSEAVAADMMRVAAGEGGALFLSLVICCASISTLNATIFTGARVYHAVGRDMPSLRKLGLWHEGGNHPRRAILSQGFIALGLIGFGALHQDGFKAMVEYTAPVFWLFMLLVSIAYFVLRQRDAHIDRPFRAPFYPLKPALFSLSCAYLLYSSTVYTGSGALVGIGVLLLGVPLYFTAHRTRS